MLEPKRGRKGRRYDVMLNYSKKVLVNTGQGAKRANPRVYTAALVGAAQTNEDEKSLEADPNCGVVIEVNPFFFTFLPSTMLYL